MSAMTCRTYWSRIYCDDHNVSYRIDAVIFVPLYLYPEEGTLETERRVNFDPKIYAEIRERAGFSPLPLRERE